MSTQQNVTQEKKPIFCRFGCGTQITFDGRKSKTGKSIPISVISLEPHNCSANPYNQNKSGSYKTATQAQPQQVNQPISSPAEKPINDNTVRTYLNLIIEKLTTIEAKLDKVIEVKEAKA